MQANPITTIDIAYLMTAIPFSLATGTSILSTPVPALPTALSRPAPASRTSLVTLVPDLTIRPS